MLHISDSLLAAGDYSCPSDCTLVFFFLIKKDVAKFVACCSCDWCICGC